MLLELDCGTSVYPRKGEQIRKNYELFLTRIIITNDDLEWLKTCNEDYAKIFKDKRLRNHLIVDLII